MAAPVVAAGAAAGVGAGTAANAAWLLSQQLRKFVRQAVMPMIGVVLLLPVIAAPFAPVAARERGWTRFRSRTLMVCWSWQTVSSCSGRSTRSRDGRETRTK